MLTKSNPYKSWSSSLKDSPNDLVNVLAWNLQGLNNKIDYLGILSSQLGLNILIIDEHWITPDHVGYLAIPGFNVASIHGRLNHIHGGTAILVDAKFSVVEIKCITEQSIEIICEATAIEFKNCIDLSLYRPYYEDVYMYRRCLECFYSMLCTLKQFNKSIVVSADFNVSFNSNDNFVKDFISLLNCFGLKATVSDITSPGLYNVRSCFDNVVTDIHCRWSATLHHTPLSDHNAINFQVLDRCNLVGNLKENVLVRLVNDSYTKSCIDNLKSINWIYVYLYGFEFIIIFCGGGIYFQLVSVEDMFKTINNLSNSTGLDIYGINSVILKISGEYIYEVLTHSFNVLIVYYSVFPDELKLHQGFNSS